MESGFADAYGTARNYACHLAHQFIRARPTHTETRSYVVGCEVATRANVGLTLAADARRPWRSVLGQQCILSGDQHIAFSVVGPRAIPGQS